MASITIDADSNSDGLRTGIESSWADARGAATGSSTTFITQAASAFQCGRYFGLFLMTGIPSGSTIDTAKIVHPQAANHVDDNGGSVRIIEHTATDPIDSNSFNDITLNGDTSFGSKTYANISTTGTTDITINSTGITYLESVIGGTAKLGLRSSFDMDNSAPGGNNQYTASPTAFDLVITYTPPVTGFLAIL